MSREVKCNAVIDFGLELVDYQGNPFQLPDGTAMTLREVCCRGLGMPLKQESSWREKMKREDLARRIFEAKEPLAFPNDETKTLIDAVNAGPFVPFLITAAIRILDPNI